MEVLVCGRNLDVDADVEAATLRKADRLPRLASDIRRVEFEFSEIKNPSVADSHECEVIVHLTGTLVKAHASAPDCRTALDRAVEKAEHQLGRVHDKRVHRAKPRRAGEAGAAPA